MLSYRAIAQGIGPRVLVTPDPTQPEMFAIRGWRYGYSLSCLDETGAKHFAQAHYRQGPEDADADPPVETPSYSAGAPSTSLPSRPRASPTPPRTSASTCTPASDAAPSSPNTLFAEIAAVSDASVSRAANVGKTFAMPATHLAVSFAMRIDTIDTAANASLRWLSLVSNDDGSTVPFHRLYLTTVGSSDGTSTTSVTEGVKLVDGGQFFGTRSLSRSPKLGEWVRFDLAVDGPGSLVIQLDGTVVVTYPLEAAWTLAFLKTLTVGEIFAFSSVGEWRVRFDDLEVRTR